MIAVHETSVQDRDGAPDVILGMLENAPLVTKLRADGGYAGPKLTAALTERGLGAILDIVHKPKETRGHGPLSPLGGGKEDRLDVPCRRRAKDHERSLESFVA